MLGSKPTTWHLRHRPLRPVSRARRLLGAAVLLLLVSGSLLYGRLTDEGRLRAYAERWLRDFSGGEVHIERVEFDPFHGLSLSGVTVATPASARFDPHDNSLAARTIFRSRGLFLRLRPFSVISGNLVVPEIVAVDPELTLVHRLSDDARNWQVLLQRRPGRPGGPSMRLPAIRMRNVRVVQFRLGERGRSGGGAQVIWADAQATPDEPQSYSLRISKVFEAGDGTLFREQGRLRINLDSLAIAGSVPSMSLDDLALVAPAGILRRLDAFHAQGYIRAESLILESGRPAEATFVLRDVSFSVPISDEEEPLRFEDRYVQLHQAAGTVEVRGGRAVVRLRARFRDSPVAVEGEVTLGPGGLTIDEAGLDLRITATGLSLPTAGPDASPAERRFVERWFRIHEFAKDYDARGRADCEVHFRKAAGRGESFQLVGGALRPAGASARYFRFPYRLYDLSGEIYFRSDGRIELRSLTGVHGPGRAVINGLVDAYVSQGLDVHVQAESIRLDEDLITCMSPRDQELIRLFNAQAQLNIGIQMHRAPARHGTRLEDNPWNAVVDAEFIDGQVRFEGFPYPLTELQGRLHIEEGGFEIHSLRAARGAARVEVSGNARRPDQGPGELDLQLKATAIPLDDVLQNALPADARAHYTRMAPEGTVDVSGRIHRRGGDEGLAYDLFASLAGGTITLPETSLRLSDARASIRVRPEELNVSSLEGRFHGSPIRLQGRFGTRSGDSFSVRAQSERLMLDERLHAAVPKAVQDVWDEFKPAGPAKIDLRYEQPAAGEQGSGSAASRPAQTRADYTAVIEPLECAAWWRAFPLALERVSGQFVLKPGELLLKDVTAHHGASRFELGGRVQLGDGKQQGELKLALYQLDFSEELRKAVPWRLRRLWNDVKPRGRVDLVLDRLTFTHDPRGHTWEARGYADLDGLSLDVGAELADLKGRVTGRGSMGESIALDLGMTLTEARVDGRLLTGARLHMVRPEGDSRLHIADLTGRFYGGDVLGELEINYAAGRPTFELSLSGRGISLEQFLNAKRRPDEPPITARGIVDGRLDLAGRFGDPASTRGAGTIWIRQAHMFKIPLVFSILQVVHGAVHDDNAFHDAKLGYAISGEDLLLEEIDLRGSSLSMVGAGRVHLPDKRLELTLLVGSPLKLPRIEVLTDLVEGVARELMEVHVEGTLEQPQLRAELVRSVRKALDAVFSARRPPPRPARRR